MYKDIEILVRGLAPSSVHKLIPVPLFNILLYSVKCYNVRFDTLYKQDWLRFFAYIMKEGARDCKLEEITDTN